MRRRHIHTALVGLYALGILAVGVWADLRASGRTDLLRDLLSTAMTLLLGAMVGDSLASLLLRWRDAGARRADWRVVPLSALAMWIGHALLPTLAMLVQVPRVGLDFLPTLLLGLEWVLRAAVLPALVVGAGVGVAALALFALARDANPT